MPEKPGRPSGTVQGGTKKKGKGRMEEKGPTRSWRWRGKPQKKAGNLGGHKSTALVGGRPQYQMWGKKQVRLWEKKPPPSIIVTFPAPEGRKGPDD